MERVATRSESFDKFRHQPSYTRQYTNVYYVRLQQLKTHIKPPKSWVESMKYEERILDLKVGEVSWVLGTITRELARKPNIFADLKKIYHGDQPVHEPKYCSKEDKLYLEDEHGRIPLNSKLKKSELLVTGIVVGLLGAQNQVGEFEVLDICYPSLPPPAPMSTPNPNKRKVALVSGFSIDEINGDEAPSLQLLLEYMSEASDISRLIICGNSLAAPAERLLGSRVIRPQTNGKALSSLDEMLSTLATILPVHLMPGKSDPTTVAFPQMPFHPAIFRKTRALLNSMALSLETNPQRFNIDGAVLLGTSGQPVDDLLKYTEETISSNSNLELELLHKTITWRHISPTAPDTLWSYPYGDEDPMIINELPHVYFTGNSSHFATEVRDGVRLICIPSFYKTREVVLLDLDTLEVELVGFDQQ